MHTESVRKQAGKSAGGHTASHDRRDAATTEPLRKSEPTPRGKTRLTMYLDLAVVEYFRSRAGGRGYQTLINEALKQAIEQEHLEDVLRRIIREEARPHPPGKGKP